MDTEFVVGDVVISTFGFSSGLGIGVGAGSGTSSPPEQFQQHTIIAGSKKRSRSFILIWILRLFNV